MILIDRITEYLDKDNLETGLEKVIDNCPSCGNIEGYCLPNGRFICSKCAPNAVINRWAKEWKIIEQKRQRRTRIRTAEDSAKKRKEHIRKYKKIKEQKATQYKINKQKKKFPLKKRRYLSGMLCVSIVFVVWAYLAGTISLDNYLGILAIGSLTILTVWFFVWTVWFVWWQVFKYLVREAKRENEGIKSEKVIQRHYKGTTKAVYKSSGEQF